MGNFASDNFPFHWAKSVLFDEIMNSTPDDFSVFSEITLAALQDSGWYQVNYDGLPNKLEAGRGKGCTFLDFPCANADGTVPFPDSYCLPTDGQLCDATHTWKSDCTQSNSGNSNDTDFMDFTAGFDICYFRVPFPFGNCLNPASPIGNMPDEVVGPNSRCIEGNLIDFNLEIPNTVGCYVVSSCSNLGAFIQVGSQTVMCPFTGGTVSVPGYYGNLFCPSSDILCHSLQCSTPCHYGGYCVNNQCVCLGGYGGSDCSVVCGLNCDACSTSNNCISCASGYTVVDGVCVIACDSYCYACNSMGSCNGCMHSAILFPETGCHCANRAESCLLCGPHQWVNYWNVTTTSYDPTDNVTTTTITLEHSCVDCEANCDVCDTNNSCIRCNVGFSLYEDTCVPNCPDGMFSFVPTGYYPVILQCVLCPANCLLCDGTGTCTECTGDGIAIMDGNCCATECNSCGFDGTCYSCNNGYDLTSDNDCCPSNCQSCTAGVCSQCYNGLIVVNNACCSPYCDVCNIGTCTHCVTY